MIFLNFILRHLFLYTILPGNKLNICFSQFYIFKISKILMENTEIKMSRQILNYVKTEFYLKIYLSYHEYKLFRKKYLLYIAKTILQLKFIIKYLPRYTN